MAFAWGQFSWSTQTIYWNKRENYRFRITATYPWDQWVNHPPGLGWVSPYGLHIPGQFSLIIPLSGTCKCPWLHLTRIFTRTYTVQRSWIRWLGRFVSKPCTPPVPPQGRQCLPSTTCDLNKKKWQIICKRHFEICFFLFFFLFWSTFNLIISNWQKYFISIYIYGDTIWASFYRQR